MVYFVTPVTGHSDFIFIIHVCLPNIHSVISTHKMLINQLLRNALDGRIGATGVIVQSLAESAYHAVQDPVNLKIPVFTALVKISK